MYMFFIQLLFYCVLTTCPMEQETSSQDHQFLRPAHPAWQCFDCAGYYFERKQSAHEHKVRFKHRVKIYTDELPRICTWCDTCHARMRYLGDLCMHESHYENHSLRQHVSLNNRYHCDSCKKTFKRGVDILRHIAKNPTHELSVH